MSHTLLKKKGKEEKQAWKRKEKKDKRADKQANSQLDLIEFLIRGVSLVEQYFSYNLSY